ncbi:hypothetical protein DBW_2600 [Desulfuromonas sp. DDH964]|uniref:hypothetical protein n=1 Tax=Desulfuromonas sp. DDH964 TaxID=1823759 RepID=UPI00078E1875|nr:hypothetical protein [Desulfuromonas sp. DDH964]AMV72928.1 hypothetical protein DBW_2600 [Desulfuromonas sp. DDH964]
MKRLTQLALVAAILLLCLLANPTRARHQQKIQEAFRSENKVLGKIGLGHLYASSFDYHNLLLCSLTSADGSVKSFGILGMVFVV